MKPANTCSAKEDETDSEVGKRSWKGKLLPQLEARDIKKTFSFGDAAIGARSRPPSPRT